jgi:cytochrome c oxidase cbb3-type subunit III
MQVRNGRTAALCCGLTMVLALAAAAQDGGRRRGGFIPGQVRPPEDPVKVAHGKTLYGVSCRGCHGADLRGGDMGGPNLLRSQVALTDRDGELIVPIIQGSRQSSGMPAIGLNTDDAKAVAAYVRSVVATIEGQGKPPSAGEAPPTIVIGDAAAGKAFFAEKCASCHSTTGDLEGIAARITDPKMLQNAWVSGADRRRRGAAPAASAPGGKDARTATVTVTLPSGEKVDGRLERIDEFAVSVGLADGTVRSFRRDGDVPKVEFHDPMQAHRDLLAVYTDKDMHDVTAYLVTLK